MVCSFLQYISMVSRGRAAWMRHQRARSYPPSLANKQQEVDETPDYTDSEDPNTTASSVVGEPTVDGRRRRAEANQLRRSIFGKKHDKLGESQVRETGARCVAQCKVSPWNLTSMTGR